MKRLTNITQKTKNFILFSLFLFVFTSFILGIIYINQKTELGIVETKIDTSIKNSYSVESFERYKMILLADMDHLKKIELQIERLFLFFTILFGFFMIFIYLVFSRIFRTLDIANKELKSNKDELETIFNTTKDSIAILDEKTNFLFFNKAYIKMTGFSKEELLTKSCTALTAQKDVQKTIAALKEVYERGHIENFEKTCVVKDGRKVFSNFSISLMPDRKRLLVSIRDVTETKRNQKIIDEYLKLIEKNVITSSTDLEGNITYVSERFCTISGYSREELLGKNHRIIKHPDMQGEIYQEMWAMIQEDKTWTGEIKNLKKDGNFYWVVASISPIYNDENEKIGYTAIRQDITDKKRIEEISITDGLTNIFNRRYFNEMFPKFIASAKRNNEMICFMILDIDNFKLYNDTYGHQAGDKVIQSVAEVLKSSLHRGDDMCFRLGGEEFGVFCKVSTKEKGFQFGEKIRQNVADLEIFHQLNLPSKVVTLSIGLVILNGEDARSGEELYRQADDLLYTSKKEGRNRVTINSTCELTDYQHERIDG